MDNMRWHRPPTAASSSDGFDVEPEPVTTEGEYLQDLSRTNKSVVIHLRSGEIFRGTIEYFDQSFLRLTRKGEPNLFIFKQDIKYFYEE